jgi:hypothetical protein
MIALLMRISFGGAYSGTAIPAASGSFSSVTEVDLMGIGINPASASGEKGLFSIDVGFIFFSLDIFLDGPEQDLLVERYGELPEGWNPIRGSVTSQGISPSPNLALRIPLKDWGIGWNFFVPYGSGASFDEKGVQRFSTNGGHLLFFENALSLARTWKRPLPRIPVLLSMDLLEIRVLFLIQLWKEREQPKEKVRVSVFRQECIGFIQRYLFMQHIDPQFRSISLVPLRISSHHL